MKQSSFIESDRKIDRSFLRKNFRVRPGLIGCWIAGFFILLFATAFGGEEQLINHLSIGPEGYWVKRTKPGGTEQTGMLWGGRLTYERLKRYGWYIGLDALYATGTLDGHASNDKKIRSTLTDTNFEARFGYTLQQNSDFGLSFTPFVGYGYFRETNNFRRPTPIPCHFKNTFTYIPLGFISHAYLFADFGIGLNFKCRYLHQNKVKVTNDPENDPITIHYKEQVQYRIELPLTYDFCAYCRKWRLTLSPFYEYRHYGSLANFRFDFIDTKFRIQGATFQLTSLF